MENESELTAPPIPDDENATHIDDPIDLTAGTFLGNQLSSEITSLLGERGQNRVDDRVDIVVIFNEWATDSKYEIVDNRLLLVGKVEDYSEKAYKLRGAFIVDLTELEDYSWMTDVVEMVDETDGELQSKGTTFVPKSSVQLNGRPRSDLFD